MSAPAGGKLRATAKAWTPSAATPSFTPKAAAASAFTPSPTASPFNPPQPTKVDEASSPKSRNKSTNSDAAREPKVRKSSLNIAAAAWTPSTKAAAFVPKSAVVAPPFVPSSPPAKDPSPAQASTASDDKSEEEASPKEPEVLPPSPPVDVVVEPPTPILTKKEEPVKQEPTKLMPQKRNRRERAESEAEAEEDLDSKMKAVASGNQAVAAAKDEKGDNTEGEKNKKGEVKEEEKEVPFDARAPEPAPEGKEGRRFYSMKRLLAMQAFYQKLSPPTGMPDVEAVIGTEAEKRASAAFAEKRGQYGKGGRGGNNRGGGNRQGGGGNKQGGGGHRSYDGPADVLMDHEVVALAKSSNRYVVKVDLEEDVKMMRFFNGVLNKLTPEKFDILLEKVKEGVVVEHVDMLKQVVNAVFEKALSEPAFSPTYAEFCLKLTDTLPTFEDEGKTQSFKRLILNRCQTEFEASGETTAEFVALSEEEKKAKRVSNKKRTLGTIRFIGELFVRNMLSSSIMVSCVKILLGNADEPEEKNIESLCELLGTVGKRLDKRASDQVDACFASLLVLSKDKKNLSSRIRFIIQDTMDLRKNRWVTRRKEEKATKISQVGKGSADAKSNNARSAYNDAGNGRQDSRRDDRQRQPMAPPARRAERDRYALPRSSPRNSSKPAGPTKDEDGWEQAGTSARKGGNFRRPQDIRTSAPASGAPEKWVRGGNNSKPSTPSGGDTRPPGTRFTRTPKEETPSRGRKPVEETGEKKTFFKPSNAFSAFGALENSDDDEKSEKEESAEEEEEVKDDEGDEGEDGPKESPEEVMVKTKIQNFIREYFTSEELAETELCVGELPTKKYNYRVSYEGVKLAIEEKGDRARELFAEFLVHALKTQVVTLKNVLDGFDRIMAKVNDLMMDIPLTLKHFGSLIGYLISHKCIPLTYLASDSTKHLKNFGQLSKLLAFTLLSLQKEKKDEGLLAVWKESGLTMTQFMRPRNENEKDIKEFLVDRKLEVLAATL